MKKFLATGAVLMLLASPALAQDKPAPDGQKPPRHGMFEQADSDGDGKVSKAEFQAQQEKFFADTDKNSDGTITRDEMKARREAMREKFKAWKAEHGRGAPDGEAKPEAKPE